MKTAAIIRILVGTVVAVVLIAALVLALTGYGIHNRFDRGDDSNEAIVQHDVASNDEERDKVEANAAMNTGSSTVAISDVDRIKINWVSGAINVVVGKGTEIAFTEGSSMPLTDTQKMHYAVHDRQLIISYCEQTVRTWAWLDIDQLHMPRKNLTVTIPEEAAELLNEIEIEAVSANVKVDGISAKKLQLESISGSLNINHADCENLELQSISGWINAENVETDKLEVETTSGKAQISCEADQVDADSVSGMIVLTFMKNAPSILDVESVSGQVDITLPENEDGFTAKLSSVSGSLFCDYPSIMRDKKCIVGNGFANYKFETVSGNVHIRKS
ncbi:MAG: DUF4097 family beta strand repeat-containing protein [Clostridia bacterium]